jgi:hypothetical protein
MIKIVDNTFIIYKKIAEEEISVQAACVCLFGVPDFSFGQKL